MEPRPPRGCRERRAIGRVRSNLRHPVIPRAFDGSSPASVIAAIMERPAPSIGDVAPPALDRLVQTCLAKDPDQRIQTARDVALAISWAVRPQSITAATRPSRKWQFALAATLVALIFVALKADRSQGPPMPSRLSSDSTSRRSSGSACPSSDSRVSESRSRTAWIFDLLQLFRIHGPRV